MEKAEETCIFLRASIKDLIGKYFYITLRQIFSPDKQRKNDRHYRYVIPCKGGKKGPYINCLDHGCMAIRWELPVGSSYITSSPLYSVSWEKDLEFK